MRLSYTAYPIWKLLESGKGDLEFERRIALAESKEFEAWKDVLQKIKTLIHSEVFYITTPFHAALLKAIPKIAKNNEIKTTLSVFSSKIVLHRDSGTIIINDPAIKQLGLRCLFLGFDKTKIVSFCKVHLENRVSCGGDNRSWFNQFDIGESQGVTGLTWPKYFALFDFFMKNCEIETKELKENEKYKRNSEKHLNETKNPITILDCTWFTTLISTMPHHVNGFLRWQPCGINFSQRKLIWVDEFDRKGFIRKAKILNGALNSS